MKMVYEQNLTEFDAAMPEENDRLNPQYTGDAEKIVMSRRSRSTAVI
jgi:hypothetical protein